MDIFTYNKILPSFGEYTLWWRYMETGPFLLSFSPVEGLILELKHFKIGFNFSEIEPSHDFFSTENYALKQKWYVKFCKWIGRCFRSDTYNGSSQDASLDPKKIKLKGSKYHIFFVLRIIKIV